MEEGRLRASPKSYFLPLGEKKPINPHILNDSKAISFAPPPMSISASADYPIAFVCRSCKKLIMPFPEK